MLSIWLDASASVQGPFLIAKVRLMKQIMAPTSAAHLADIGAGANGVNSEDGFQETCLILSHGSVLFQSFDQLRAEDGGFW